MHTFIKKKKEITFLIVIQKDNEQIKCKIQLNLKKKFYFIKGVPINYTPSQIKDQLKMKLGTLKVLLIRTARAKYLPVQLNSQLSMMNMKYPNLLQFSERI